VYLHLFDNLADRPQQVTESNDKNKAVIILYINEKNRQPTAAPRYYHQADDVEVA